MSTLLARSAARAPERIPLLLRDALAIKLVLAAVTLAAVLGVAGLTGEPVAARAIISFFTIGMLVNSTASMFDALARAGGRAAAAGISTLIGSVAGLAAAALLVANPGGARAADAPEMAVWAATFAYIISAAVHFGLSVWTSRRWWRLPAGRRAGAEPTEGRWAGRAAMLREAVPLTISGVFITLYFRTGTLMLHAMAGERAAGLFGGMYRIFELLAVMAVAFRTVLFPIIARTADGPREALAALFRKSMRLHMLFAILVAVFFTIEARSIVSLVLGPGYEDAAPGLAVLIWALPCAYMADTLIHIQIAKGQQLATSWAVAVVALVNVALNLVAIPRWGTVGACGATVLSEALCFVLLFVAFRRAVPGVTIGRAAVPPIAAGALGGVTLMLAAPWLPAGALGLALGVIAALVGYAGALIILRAVGREDVTMLRELLPPRSAP